MPSQLQIPNTLPLQAQLCLEEAALIPSSYGQLVFLARQVNHDTGRYGSYDRGDDLSGDLIDKVLRQFHEIVFERWINSPLQHKMADIELYIAGLTQVNRGQLVDAWLRLTPYKHLLPASIQGPERDKHVSDFEAILGLLKNVYGVPGPDPRA